MRQHHASFKRKGTIRECATGWRCGAGTGPQQGAPNRTAVRRRTAGVGGGLVPRPARNRRTACWQAGPAQGAVRSRTADPSTARRRTSGVGRGLVPIPARNRNGTNTPPAPASPRPVIRAQRARQYSGPTAGARPDCRLRPCGADAPQNTACPPAAIIGPMPVTRVRLSSRGSAARHAGPMLVTLLVTAHHAGQGSPPGHPAGAPTPPPAPPPPAQRPPPEPSPP